MKKPLILLTLLGALCIFTLSLDAKVKNAEKYGFLPSATPEQNSEALQKCVDGVVVIRVTKPGAEIPAQENMVFDKVFVEADIPNLISAITLVNPTTRPYKVEME